MLLLILPFVACSDDDVIESGGSITFGKTELEVVHGWKEQLDVTVTPADARYFWSVTPGDTIVATIDSTNMVTGLLVGETELTATLENGEVSATCKITVVPARVMAIEVEPILELDRGDSYLLRANVLPETVKNMDVTWESSNPEVATVLYGRVRAVKEGTTTITVTTDQNHLQASCEVEVIPYKYPTFMFTNEEWSFEFWHDTYVFTCMGETVDIQTDVPADLVGELEYKSLNERIATVDKNGRVAVQGYGSTDIEVSFPRGINKKIFHVEVDW